MREHPLIASPLSGYTSDPTLDPDVDFSRRPYDTQEAFPSDLGPGGIVRWEKFSTGEDGWVEISYPEIGCVRSKLQSKTSSTK